MRSKTSSRPSVGIPRRTDWRAGERVMESLKRFITRKLKLKVNEQKSAVARPSERSWAAGSAISGDAKHLRCDRALRSGPDAGCGQRFGSNLRAEPDDARAFFPRATCKSISKRPIGNPPSVLHSRPFGDRLLSWTGKCIFPTPSGFAFEKSLKACVRINGWRVILHQTTRIRSRTVIAVLLTAEHAEERQLLTSMMGGMCHPASHHPGA